MSYIEEPARKLTTIASADVVVVGGGIAGVAAAIAAAREGAKVILLEKEYGMGGLATLGNVTIYLPICDGRGRQVIGGLGEELLHLSVANLSRNYKEMRFEKVPECWFDKNSSDEDRSKHRFQSKFNPAFYQIEMEHLLMKEGVEIYYDTRFCSSVTANGKMTHVIIENKEGRSAIAAKAFVDASGDADVCHSAGEGTATWDYNVLCGWHFMLFDKEVKLHPFTTPYKFTADGEGCEIPHLSGQKAKDVTRQVLESRAIIREKVKKLNEENPDIDVQPFAISSIPSFRATRRLNNTFAMRDAHMHQYFDDTVGLTGDWRRKGPVYAIPLRALQADKNSNLFSAGRCISADTDVWDVTRVIPTCAVTGEAAGAAAAITAMHHNGDGTQIKIKSLQETLKARNVLLSPKLVAEKPE